MLLVLMLWLAQAPLTGTWVGPMELTVESPRKTRGHVPTVVEIEQEGASLKGSWRSLPPNTMSGLFTGTVTDKNEVDLRLTFYTDGDTADGGLIPERCSAEADFSGRLTVSGVLYITAKRVLPDKRPRRECAQWPSDFVWVLQRH